MTLKERVQIALKNAAENGYHFKGWTNEEIAIDMTTYDSDLEDETVEAVEAALNEIGAE